MSTEPTSLTPIEAGQHVRYALDTGTVCSELLRRRAETCSDHPLLLFGEERWTYAECWVQSIRFQKFLLQKLFLEKDSARRVVIFLENRPQTVFAWFGAQLAGFVSVLVNRGHRGALLEYQLRTSLAEVLVTDAKGLERVKAATKTAPKHIILSDNIDSSAKCLGAFVTPWSDLPAAADVEQEEQAPHTPAPGDLCSVLFTSGTTGRSKAVRIPQNMIARGAARLADAFGFQSGDIYHGWLPLYHIGGLLHTLMSMVVCGGTVALIPKFSLSRFWTEVRLYQCTIFAGFGSTINLLWRAPETDADSDSSLRIGLSAMCSPEILRAFERRFGVLLLDSYGMTEVEPVSLPPGPNPLPPGCCGKANPDFEVVVVDEQDLPIDANEVGEILVRPRVPHNIMQGYENDAAATMVAWRNLWMHTGDLGRIDSDGYIYITGRIKDMIRRRGENISAWEIENILGSHPSIRDCAVLGIPTDVGEEEVKVVVVPADGVQLTHMEVRDICKRLLSAFMVPRYVEIRDVIPLNHLGKVDKDKLRQISTSTVDLLQSHRN